MSDFLRRAHIYWVRVPDEPSGKKRPALVVSADVRNRFASDVIVAPISTVPSPSPTHVRVRAREGGFSRPSVIKCEQGTTLWRDRLSTKPLGGALSVGRMVDVEKTILRAIDVPVE